MFRFRLRDRTRRRICLFGFSALCILPTAVVLAWCIARHLPGHVAAEAGRLSANLGLSVSLAKTSHPRPGVVRYHRLDLSDPETGETVLRCRMLEAAYATTSGQEGPSRPLLTFVVSQPEVAAAHLDPLRQLIARALKHCIDGGESDIRLVADQVTLQTEDGPTTLTDLSAAIASSSDGSRAAVSLRLAGIEAPKPIQFRIVRSRQVAPPAIGFELDTGGASVPCGLLALGLPDLKPLGPQSRFRGILLANQVSDPPTPDAWAVELTGQLSDVDLDRPVAEHSAHRLSGLAQISIQSARFRLGRLEEAYGLIEVGPGVISRSLIDAAAYHLGLSRGVDPKQPGNLVQYEQFAAGFQIDSEGLVLQGRCTRTDPGAILVDRYNCLLGGPISRRLPLVALLQTLAADSEPQVPATRETAWLMRRLPLPQTTTPQTTTPQSARRSVSPHPE